MTTGMAYHQSHIMICSTSQNKIGHETVMSSAVLYTVKYNISLRLIEAMLKTWQKLVFKTNKFHSWTAFQNLVQHLNTTKQNEKSTFKYKNFIFYTHVSKCYLIFCHCYLNFQFHSHICFFFFNLLSSLMMFVYNATYHVVYASDLICRTYMHMHAL